MISRLSQAFAAHTHIIPAPVPVPIPPSPDGGPQGAAVKVRAVSNLSVHIPNLEMRSKFTRQNFLKVTSPIYINSRHVYTT